MTGCQVMAKPASSRCNLDCHYCFYIDKPSQPVMDDATLEAFICQHIAAQPVDDVLFAWQGGEPTLCGLDFFHRVVALQKRYGEGKRIQNTFQTNGILLSDEWCRFLRDNGWLVGISLDGPADLHDAYRVSRSGKPTHHKVVEAIARLVAHRVDFNLLVVVNRLNSQQPARMYRYLRQLGTPFLQFIPLVERDDSGKLTADSVTSEDWGHFLNDVFDLWVREDIGRVFVQLFDSMLGVWSGHPAQMCALSETCGHAFALEANGDLYQCDHYVYPAFRLGNIHQTPLHMLNASPQAREFGQQKKSTLGADCLDCALLRFCNGDCPKHRDLSGKSVLCGGYKAFINHTSPHMRVMRDLIKQHRSPMELMAMLR
ncbi:TPA: anaerobic sulfatase maturase [Citrobacter koseri]|uniref:anaerobic sulfatase maturase n=1 Tax=Citrobacter TaxID=544 RepID=UPI0013573FD1|nr:MULTISPECIES: anaerobic sulfatase maturase [Citrobacter]MDM2992972.1 anaerobic sulfatase maturase [Citrobacter sp. CK190]WEE17382.1 anaerobic sulfatase maturase [Citrobacter koseri]WQD97674.1 anaerobic sulfatase maturase [Citrobacter koseri]HCD7729956.1 anaerobic sulfatase maturase [Citrobacter koseri]HCR9740887.1 anaerobic sulfatase maturase [Citrobacter koseri]